MPVRSLSSTLPLPRTLRLAWTALVLCGLLSLLFCGVRKLVWGLGLRDSFPLSSPVDRFGDFTIYWHLFDRLHTAAFFRASFPFTYPAPVALGYDLFLHHAGSHPLIAFVTVCVLALLLPAAGYAVALRRRGLAPGTAYVLGALLLLFSWPAILVVDRANMEIFVWVTLVLALLLYVRGRGTAAAVLFGLAASLKLFPFVYLGLFVSARDWRRLALGLASFAAATVAALAFVGPTISVANRGIQNGILFFRNNYMITWRPIESGVDHSLFNLYKTAYVGLTRANAPGHTIPTFDGSLSVYLVLTAIAGVVLYVVRIQSLPLVNQILLFAVCSILLTAFSGDGTLLHLYPPFALLTFLVLAAARAERPVAPGLQPCLLLLALLVAPLSFAMVGHTHVEGLLHCLLLLGVLGCGLLFPFGPSLATSLATGCPLLRLIDEATVPAGGSALPPAR